MDKYNQVHKAKISNGITNGCSKLAALHIVASGIGIFRRSMSSYDIDAQR
jgi:hypothetical protein